MSDIPQKDSPVSSLLVERERCSQAAAAAVMKFRHKVGGKYYPGYHEDMRDAVREAIKNV